MDVAHIVLSAQPPTYAAILELDRKVRQLPFPEAFRPKSSDPADMAKERLEPGYHSGRSAVMEFYASQFRTVSEYPLPLFCYPPSQPSQILSPSLVSLFLLPLFDHVT